MARKSKKAEAVATEVEPRWLLLSYAPVSLFSLRSTMSTNKGGKTLLVPTPYAIKMALIDAVFRDATPDDADALGRRVFDCIKARRVRVRPPRECIVENTFVKIRQDASPPDKKKGHDESEYQGLVLGKLLSVWRSAPEGGLRALGTKELKKRFKGLYEPTISYRELVFFSGRLDIAIDSSGWSDADLQLVRRAASRVNYLGKRGSFFQFLDAEDIATLPTGFTLADGDPVSEIPLGIYGVSQHLDDFGAELCKARDGFERISTFHPKPMTIGKHRVLVSTLIPYTRAEATRSFTRYIANSSDI